LCQFINYLARNSMLFLEDDHCLYSFMSEHLHHLTRLFEWDSNKCLKDMKQEYILPEGKVQITDQIYRKLIFSLKETIDKLIGSVSDMQQVAL
jgi:uncharacterized Zn-finger protein